MIEIGNCSKRRIERAKRYREDYWKDSRDEWEYEDESEEFDIFVGIRIG